MAADDASLSLQAAAAEVPKVLDLCAEAQSAAIGAVLSELQAWKELALYGAEGVAEGAEGGSGRKRKREAEADDARAAAAEEEVRRLKDRVRALEADVASKDSAVKDLAKQVAEAKAERPNADKLSDALRKCEAREQEALRLAEKYRSKRRCLAYVLEARQEIASLCAAHPEVKQKLAKVMARWKTEYTNLSPDREGSIMSRGMSMAGYRASSRRREPSMMPKPSPFAPPSTAGQGFMCPPSRTAAPSMSRAEVLRRLTYDDFTDVAHG